MKHLISPTFPALDPTNVLLVDSEVCGGNSLGTDVSADLLNVVPCQLGIQPSLTVNGLAHGLKMIRIYTSRLATQVVDYLSLGKRPSVSNLPSESVGKHKSSFHLNLWVFLRSSALEYMTPCCVSCVAYFDLIIPYSESVRCPRVPRHLPLHGVCNALIVPPLVPTTI